MARNCTSFSHLALRAFNPCYTSSRLITIQHIPTRHFSDATPTRPRSPGGRDGVIADSAEQAVGREYEEIDANEKGFERFELGPLIDPFGTLKSPAIIFSSFKSRIVGCVGGGGYPHRLLWFELKAGKKHLCRECGQAFKLETAANTDVHQQTSSHAQ